MHSTPITAALFAGAGLAVVPPQSAAARSQSVIAIVGATMIDGNGGAPLVDGTLVTRDTRGFSQRLARGMPGSDTVATHSLKRR